MLAPYKDENSKVPQWLHNLEHMEFSPPPLGDILSKRSQHIQKKNLMSPAAV